MMRIGQKLRLTGSTIVATIVGYTIKTKTQTIIDVYVRFNSGKCRTFDKDFFCELFELIS